MAVPAKVVQRLKASKEARAHELSMGQVLVSAGWKHSAQGWRHPHLDFPWSLDTAVRLQSEADAGLKDAACSYLRGDCWPL